MEGDGLKGHTPLNVKENEIKVFILKKLVLKNLFKLV